MDAVSALVQFSSVCHRGLKADLYDDNRSARRRIDGRDGRQCGAQAVIAREELAYR